MRKKDHYKTLGVERTTDECGIRTAFRELAKKYHPDISGPEETRRFQEIVEAYSILSDPESRSAYNKLLLERNAPRAAHVAAGCAEPLKAAETFRSPHASFWGSHFDYAPISLVEKFFDRLFNDFTQRRPGYRRFHGRKVLDVEVVLSHEEAAGGGVLPLWYPAVAQCRLCGGAGLAGRSICSACRGHGVVVSKKAVRIRLPAGVSDGSMFEVTIDDPGTPGIVLRLHILVTNG